MKRRIFSLMLALVMVLGVVPLGTIFPFAFIIEPEPERVVVTNEDELTEAIDTEAAYIELGDDIAVDYQIHLSHSYTLDLAGHVCSDH